MDDLISRQTAIDTLNVGTEFLRRVLDETDIVGAERAKYEWGLGLIESYISDMKELPSADPERESAEWVCWYEEIKNDTCTEYIPHCKCPECGTEYDPHTVKFINFCSYCGAKMGGNHDFQSYTGIY